MGTKKTFGQWLYDAIFSGSPLPTEAELVEYLLTGKVPPLTLDADAEILQQPAPQQKQIFLPPPRDENGDDNADERGDFKETNTMDIEKSARVEMAQKFFDELYGRIEGVFFTYLWIHRKSVDHDEKKTIPFDVRHAEERAKIANQAISFNDEGWQVYFGVHLTYKYCSPNERPHDKDIVAQAAVITDIDVESPWHVSSDKKIYPPDIETAKSFLPFEPSILVDSGGGIHAYFGIITDHGTIVRFEGDDDAKTAVKARNKKLIECVRQRAGKYAGAVDSVFDLPRVFRVPGTYNLKNGREGAPLCKVISYGSRDYNVDEFDSKLEKIYKPEQSATTETATTDATTTAAADDFASVNNLEPTPLNEIIKPREPAADDSQPVPKNDSVVAQGSNQDTDFSADPPALVLAKVRECLKLIDPSALGYGDWLPLMSGCKGAGLTYEEFDAFAQRDTAERYTPKENLASWQGSHGNFDEHVVIKTAQKQANFDPAEFTRQWYRDHPEFQRRSSTSNQRDDSADDEALRDKIFEKIRGTSDLANADRFVVLAGDKIRYLRKNKRWLTYKRGLWTPSAKNCVDELIPLVIDAARKITAAAKSEAEQKIAASFTDSRKISGIFFYLKRDELVVTQADLDKEPYLLNCRNCVVDLRTGRTYTFEPERLMTKQVQADYRPDCTDETFKNFIADIQPDEDDQHALQRYLGYSITGETGGQSFLVCRGRGANGKGTMTQFMVDLLDDYATPLRTAAILKGKSQDPNGATNATNILIGRRFAVVDEFNKGDRLDMAIIKRITGGDPMAMRGNYEDEQKVLLHVKLLLSSNDAIEIDSTDGGFQRRFLYMPFLQTYDDDGLGTKRADPTLKKRLATDDSKSGALNWLVKGAKDYYRERDTGGGKKGLYVSPNMRRAAAEYVKSQDFLKEFIAEYCVFTADGAIPKAEFLKRLDDEYPRETKRYTTNSLHDMILQIDGITHDPRHYFNDSRGQKSSYVGIKWRDGDSYEKS